MTLPRKAWWTVYVLGCLGTMTASLAFDWWGWTAVAWGLMVAFTVAVDPAPRTYRQDPRDDLSPCDCPRCPGNAPVKDADDLA